MCVLWGNCLCFVDMYLWGLSNICCSVLMVMTLTGDYCVSYYPWLLLGNIACPDPCWALLLVLTLDGHYCLPWPFLSIITCPGTCWGLLLAPTPAGSHCWHWCYYYLLLLTRTIRLILLPQSLKCTLFSVGLYADIPKIVEEAMQVAVCIELRLDSGTLEYWPIIPLLTICQSPP